MTQAISDIREELMWIQRTLSPTAAPLSWREIMEGLHGWFSEARAEEKLKKELCDYFDVPNCWLVSSGKAALTLILKAIHSLSPEKRSVLIPAYTCYSVASSVVKAGLSVDLGDVDPETLDFNYSLLESQLTGQTLCLVINHLLGRPADLNHCLNLAHSKGIRVVEDAAQVMGIGCQGKAAGTKGDVGFFSLGRGKVICAVEGGIIVTRNPDLATALQREYRKLPPYTWREKVILLAKAIALVCFLRPSLYWLPDHLPFLKLGQTEFSTKFPLKRMSGFQCGLMRRWKGKMIRLNKARLERTQVYQRLLGHRLMDHRLMDHKLPSPHHRTLDQRPMDHRPLDQRLPGAVTSAHGLIDNAPSSLELPETVRSSLGLPSKLPPTHEAEPAPLPFLRFPLIVEDPKKREQLYQLARRRGLGISRMYPDSIDGIEQLDGQVLNGNYPAARKLAQTLLTLPTHPLISPKDQKRIIRLVSSQ